LLSVSHEVVGALLFAILSLTAIDPACVQAVTPTDAHSTLVQDLVTGVFLLLENAMQVGDFVSVSGLSGTVENLSVRSIRLRAGDGSVTSFLSAPSRASPTPIAASETRQCRSMSPMT
jgi:hypothetical protein